MSGFGRPFDSGDVELVGAPDIALVSCDRSFFTFFSGRGGLGIPGTLGSWLSFLMAEFDSLRPAFPFSLPIFEVRSALFQEECEVVLVG